MAARREKTSASRSNRRSIRNGKQTPIDTNSKRESWLRRFFAIDTRSLAAFRVALGVLLLTDLGIRFTDLAAMYTDDGMFSRMTICRYYTSAWNWSFHFGSGTWIYQAILFGLAATFALALLIGFESRLATMASWLMLVSLHNRVPPILHGGDNLVRMLLFWGMFLPLGATWSVDAWLAKRRGRPSDQETSVASVASAAILLQMAIMYLFSGIFKSNPDWFYGTAIADTLPHSFYGSPLGLKLLAFPNFLAVLTVGVLSLEWLGPFLLFFPVYTTKLRLLILGLLVTMHLGIAILLNVGLFSFASVCGLILFLPTQFWDKLGGRSAATTDAIEQVERTTVRPLNGGASPVFYSLQVLCGLAFAFVVFTNLNALPARYMPWKRQAEIELLTIGCGLGQEWDMFAESPSRSGWYVAKATLADGSQVDLLREDATLSWEKPEDPAALYANERWLKCFREMAYADQIGYQVFRKPVAEYLCRQWNRRHSVDQRISNFALIFCTEEESPYGFSSAPVTKRETFVSLDGPEAEKI